jgi:hypothetical protein
MSSREIERMVALAPEIVRERIRTNADRHRYSLLNPSREAGSREFIYEERRGKLAVHVRSWFINHFGLEAELSIEPVAPTATRVRVRFQVPRADRVLNAIALAWFVGLPLLALFLADRVDRIGTLVFLAGSVTYLVLLPLAYRMLHQDERRLAEFLELVLPEAGRWRNDST